MKVTSLKCPNCGAPYNPAHIKCEFCSSVIILSDEKQYNVPEQIVKQIEDEGKNCPGVYVFGTLLGSGEVPLRLGVANYYKNAFISVGGKVLLTKKSLQFSSHKFLQNKKTVVIPLDEVVRVEYDGSNLGISDQISVYTAERRHKFVVYGGRVWVDMINKAINGLNNQTETVVTETVAVSADYVEELKKLKELLDAGIITEEEFAIKKRMLLNI